MDSTPTSDVLAPSSLRPCLTDDSFQNDDGRLGHRLSAIGYLLLPPVVVHDAGQLLAFDHGAYWQFQIGMVGCWPAPGNSCPLG